MCCMQMYGRKNLRILYDAISTLCDAIGGALAEVRSPDPWRNIYIGLIQRRHVLHAGHHIWPCRASKALPVCPQTKSKKPFSFRKHADMRSAGPDAFSVVFCSQACCRS